MKKANTAFLILILGLAGIILANSDQARQGAYNGLILAQNTIIPSLTPVLILFFLVMKSQLSQNLSQGFGGICQTLFNLPKVTFPAIFFGLVGGYPVGVLLTEELFNSGGIDEKQARRMMRFNFCAGCGFAITAVGSACYSSAKLGGLLLASNILSSVTIGIILSFSEKRKKESFYSFQETLPLSSALNLSTTAAIKSVLSITAYIIIFSSIFEIIQPPSYLTPIFEITKGLCSGNKIPSSQIAFFMSFGGVCIHLQLLDSLTKVKMKYYDFLFFRIFSALLSYGYMEILTHTFPIDSTVFSNQSIKMIEFSSVNTALSVLLIMGCFIIVFDIASRKIA